MVRTCQNSLGQNGTHLGLLLLHVGPNGNRFGGQALMEHYSAVVVTDLFGSVRERVKAFTRIECKFCIGGGRSFDQLTVRW
jgi:hypothetical protein